ncbi:Aste57867_23644 [Aphanomyces stellatus]|uniref:Aste57867_23644 protein n=1 Tax=Aphanomyces stellatus TaxID=120398 RepID=A0A485LPX4_9STRA|nr:hypothetical protein As57867_023572 [Aphanomyces stellatus]VFU00289.1 Aste57867_23644 [Aphanomyces stellatus]
MEKATAGCTIGVAHTPSEKHAIQTTLCRLAVAFKAKGQDAPQDAASASAPHRVRLPSSLQPYCKPVRGTSLGRDQRMHRRASVANAVQVRGWTLICHVMSVNVSSSPGAWQAILEYHAMGYHLLGSPSGLHCTSFGTTALAMEIGGVVVVMQRACVKLGQSVSLTPRETGPTAASLRHTSWIIISLNNGICLVHNTSPHCPQRSTLAVVV